MGKSSAHRQIYLDNNATTAVDPEVVEAMVRCWREIRGNPSSQHWAGRRARRMFDEARRKIGLLLGAAVETADEDQIIFTSGGTEANNLALRGLAAQGGRLVVSAIEHPSVLEAARALAATGTEVIYLAPEPSGVVPLAQWEPFLEPPTRVVSLMLANNETGIVQPVAELAKKATSVGIAVHTDAVQAVGKLPVHFRQLGVTSLAAAAHKFHGPVGVGVLLVRHGVRLTPWLYGGWQQQGLRPGTESVALAVGMCRALERWQQEAQERFHRMCRLRQRFEQRLQARIPDVVVIGAGQQRLPNTSHVAFLGCDRQALFLALDARGVACSIGSACASGSSEPSPVLRAMGCPEAWAASAIRFSLGADTTDEEIDEAVCRVEEAVQQVRHATGTRLLV